MTKRGIARRKYKRANKQWGNTDNPEILHLINLTNFKYVDISKIGYKNYLKTQSKITSSLNMKFWVDTMLTIDRKRVKRKWRLLDGNYRNTPVFKEASI